MYTCWFKTGRCVGENRQQGFRTFVRLPSQSIRETRVGSDLPKGVVSPGSRGPI